MLIRYLERFGQYLSSFREISYTSKLLLATSFLGSIPLGITSIIQSLYLKSLGYSPSSIGLLFGIVSVSSTVFMIPGSLLADHYSRKNIIFTGIFTYMLYLVIYGMARDFFSLSIGSLLNGFSWGIYNASFTALLADNTNEEKRTTVFSLNSFLFNVAFIIGNISSGLVDVFEEFYQIVPITSYQILFFLGIIITFMSLIPLVYYREKKVLPRKMEFAQIVKFKSWDIMKKFFTFNFLIGFGAGFFIPFLPLYMILRYSVSDTLVGNALALSNAVIAIAFLISPHLVAKIGTVKSIVLTQGLSIIPLLMIPHLGQFDYFIVTYSLRAVLMNMASPITASYMMSVVDENERASISGITATAWTGGNAISAIIAGFIMDVSLDLPIYLCSLFYCLSTVLFYFSFRSKNSKVKS